MRIPRIHTPDTLTVGDTVTLDKNAANHIYRVLRMRVGNQLILFNGSGGEYDAILETADRNHVSARIEAHRDRDNESPLPIILVQGISRGERMDYTIQKSVELGVREIYPVFSEHGSVQLKNERLIKKQHHWQAIVVSACEQCGRTRIPRVHTPATLDRYLEQYEDNGTGILLDPVAGRGITSLQKPGSSTTLLIGPEGGLSPGEISAARDQGFIGIQLGPRILRTETAAIAAIAALQTLWGDFSC